MAFFVLSTSRKKIAIKVRPCIDIDLGGNSQKLLLFLSSAINITVSHADELISRHQIHPRARKSQKTRSSPSGTVFGRRIQTYSKKLP